MRTSFPVPAFALCLGFLISFGCQSVAPPSGQRTGDIDGSAMDRTIRQEQALRSFIRGATLDAKGQVAEAILEYQEALQFGPNAAVSYALSRDFSRLGKHPRAIEYARDAVRRDSMNITYRQNLAAVYLMAFQQDRAIEEYEAIVRLDSTSTASWFALGRIYQQSKPLRALEIYDRLLDREGDDLEVLYQSAAILFAFGRYGDAAERLHRMLELDPGNRALQRQLADAYGKSGKIDEAIRILEHMLAVDNKDVETTAVLADVYLDQKNYVRATGLYEQLLNQGITNPEVKLRIGVGFFAQAERDSTLLPRARLLLEQVRDELPRDWRAYWYLGAIAGSIHEDSAAQRNFRKVTDLAPWNGDAWWFLTSYEFDHARYEKALEILERARKAVPKEARFIMLQGLSYSRLGQKEKALTLLEQAYRLNPTDMNTLSSLALEYEGAKRYTDADRTYEEALKVDPKAAIILNNYGYSLAERGLQIDRALGMAKQAVAAEPENPSYLDTLGWIYFKLGRYQEAAELIERAVRGEASTVIHEHLGDVYSKLGETAKARTMWQKALDLDPTNSALKAKIERGTF